MRSPDDGSNEATQLVEYVLPARMPSDPKPPFVQPDYPCLFHQNFKICKPLCQILKVQRRILLFLLFLPIILSSAFGE